MTTAQQLNAQFGIARQLSFVEEVSGLIVATISNNLGSASLCLQGAHLMTWQPRNQTAPVIWLSRDARLAAGKSIRGGVPVCWPWFGAHANRSGASSIHKHEDACANRLPHPILPPVGEGENASLRDFHGNEPGFPAHGYARTVPWEVIESGSEPCGATRLTLRLKENEQTRALWPCSCILNLTVIVGEKLRMELSTENTGESAFVISEALHAYFQIGDIGAVRVTGLTGCNYWDKVGASTLKKQDGLIRFTQETDRIYIDTAAECVIEDDMLKRRIRITKSGSLATVVWTPWIAKADRMGDLGQPDGWREMLCVESANAADNTVEVAAGSQHTLKVEYSAESL